MRRAFGGAILRDDSLRIISVNLGADFCAEHEHGFSGIKERFGIGEKKGLINRLIGSEKLGIDARRITNKVDSLLKFDIEIDARLNGEARKTKMHGLGMTNPYFPATRNSVDQFTYHTSSTWFDRSREEVLAYWSDSRFLLLLESELDISDLAEAFSNLDIAMWMGGSGAFKNAGLTIAIASRLPKEFTDELLKLDLDRIELIKAAEATGIYDTLKKAGKGYYALSPRWKDETKKEIIFWLNPWDQHIYNYGWYGIADLTAWAKGEGPIIKAAESV